MVYTHYISSNNHEFHFAVWFQELMSGATPIVCAIHPIALRINASASKGAMQSDPSKKKMEQIHIVIISVWPIHPKTVPPKDANAFKPWCTKIKYLLNSKLIIILHSSEYFLMNNIWLHFGHNKTERSIYFCPLYVWQDYESRCG